MTTRTLLTIALATMALTLALPAAAAVEDEPGYIDLEFIEIPDDAVEVQDIDLTTMLESIADDARADGEHALADLLAMMRSVRVKFFAPTGDDEDVKDDVARVMKQLDDNDWSRIVYIKDGEETLSVSTRNVDGNIVGLTVVMYEPGEVGFVNVVGDIDLGRLMTMSADIDFDDLEVYVDKYGHGHDEHHHVE